MNLCESALRQALADSFMFYMEAHFFHWNVEGPTFSQLHELFQKIYEDMDGAMDGLAEHIRTLGKYAPASLAELTDDSKIITTPVYGAEAMVAKLLADNEIVSNSLSEANEAAGAEYPQIANYLQDRMDKHAKWGWFLRSTLEPEKRMFAASSIYDHPRSQ